MAKTDTDRMQVKTLLGPCALIFCSSLTGTWRVVRPVVDMEKCIQCGICEKHCPTDVMTTGKKGTDPKVIIDFAYCKGCGICAEVCSRNAIEMIDERQV